METKKVKNVRLFIDNSKVFVSKLEIDIQDTSNKAFVFIDDDDNATQGDLDLVETEKFIAESECEWELVVYLNYIKDFESREEFDQLNLPIRLRNKHKREEKISFEDALSKIGVEFSLSKNYYLEHQDEIENDLNRKLTNTENLTDQFPEKEILYKQLCKLFGENSLTNNEYDYTLEEFHYFDFTGADMATAKQGEYYLKFFYYCS